MQDSESTAARSDEFGLPEGFARMPRWWNDEAGRAWLADLPALVAEQCRRWELEIDGEPMHGSNALVVPVRRGGAEYVLRLAPPGDDIGAEAAALRFWDGRGTVRLFDVDLEARTMLLERLDGKRSLATVPLQQAVEVIAQLINDLARPTPDGTRTTSELAREQIDSFERDWSAIGTPTPRHQLDIAIGLAAGAADRPAADTAVDGDLHCNQILTARDGRWVVVDPVLLAGDPEYDFARVLWDRLDELTTDAEVLSVFERFVRCAGVPRDRARSWIVQRSMSYLLWGIPRGLTWDPPKCQRLLDIFS